MDLTHLPVRDQLIYRSIVDLLASHPNGVPAIRLAYELNPRDGRILKQLLELKANVQKKELSMPDAMAAKFLAFCEDLEDRRRGSVRRAAGAILEQHLSGHKRFERLHVDSLVDALTHSLSQDVEVRVSRLRKMLQKLSEREADKAITISRAPYRVLEVAKRKIGLDASPIRSYFVMFDRPAWLHAPSYRETRSFISAQKQLRQAFSTGFAKTDDGSTEIGRGTAKSDLRDPRLRDELERLAIISHAIGQIFNLFYEPEIKAGPSIESDYVMRDWCRPVAARVVVWLNASRNAILHSVNHLYTPMGKKPYTLIRGHGTFPEGWIEPGSVPEEPILVADEQLWAERDSLRTIGLNGPQNT